MPSGLKSGLTDTDLDSLFKARTEGDPLLGSATGICASDGADLRQRYYPSEGTHDRVASATHWRTSSGGAGFKDLQELFRRIGYAGDPQITAQPSGAIKRVGESVTFSVSVTGTAPITYQWRKDGSDIGGATSMSLTLNPILVADGGVYDCVIDGIEIVTSASASLGIAPTVTSHPSNISAASGSGPHALQATATGGGTLLFQWFKDGVAVHALRPGNLSATQDQHVFNPGGTGDNGTYYCQVSNLYGIDDSDTATVAYGNVPPAVTTDPTGIDGVAGHGPYALQCFATPGSGSTFQFEWYKDGVSFVGPRPGNLSGGAGDQHVFNPLGSGDAGNYFCRVTTTHGSDDSATVAVTVS